MFNGYCNSITGQQTVQCCFEGMWITVFRQSSKNKTLLVDFFDLELSGGKSLFLKRSDLNYMCWTEAELVEFQQGEYYDIKDFHKPQRQNRNYYDRGPFEKPMNEPSAEQHEKVFPTFAQFESYAPPPFEPPRDEVSESTKVEMNQNETSESTEKQTDAKLSQMKEDDVIAQIPRNWNFDFPDGDVEFETSEYTRKFLLGVRWATFTRMYKNGGQIGTKKFCLGAFECPDEQCLLTLKPITDNKGVDVRLKKGMGSKCFLHHVALEHRKCSSMLTVIEFPDGSCSYLHHGNHQHRKPAEEGRIPTKVHRQIEEIVKVNPNITAGSWL
jgi:hypothetical protein